MPPATPLMMPPHATLIFSPLNILYITDGIVDIVTCRRHHANTLYYIILRHLRHAMLICCFLFDITPLLIGYAGYATFRCCHDTCCHFRRYAAATSFLPAEADAAAMLPARFRFRFRYATLFAASGCTPYCHYGCCHCYAAALI